MRYNTLLSDLSVSRFFFSEDRCLNRCNILFAISRVEDCLELNFKYADYQTLDHLFYSSCVCLTSVCSTRAQRFLSVRVLINASTATAANNFKLAFIQSMHLLVIDFGLANRLVNPSFIHLCTNLHAQHSGSLVHATKQTG